MEAPPTRERVFRASVPGVRRARRWSEALAASAGLGARARFRLSLAVSEAVANALRHGYDGRSGDPIRVRFESDEREIRFLIKDWGKGFDPDCYSAPRVEALPESGLGLMLIRALVDRVEFRSIPGEGTEIYLFKTLRRE